MKRFVKWLLSFFVSDTKPTGDPLDDAAFLHAVWEECEKGNVVFSSYNSDGTWEIETEKESE